MASTRKQAPRTRAASLRANRRFRRSYPSRAARPGIDLRSMPPAYQWTRLKKAIVMGVGALVLVVGAVNWAANSSLTTDATEHPYRLR